MESKYWIRNPSYDLFFFCAIWWLPLSLLIFGATITASTAIFFLLYHLFIRVPHFAATLNFTYLYKDNREYYRANWVKYFGLPILILGAYAVRLRFNPLSLYSLLLLTIAKVWGMQHIGLQNYGLLSLYRGRSAARADALLPKLERAVFYELIVLAIFKDVFQMWHLNAPGFLLKTVSWGLFGLFGFTCAAYLTRIWMQRKITPVSFPLLLYFATAVVVMIHWPIYDRLGAAIGGGMIFFYVFNGQHCLAYLGLQFHMESNKKLSQHEFGSLAEGSFGFARFYAPLAVGAAALLAVAGYGYLRSNGSFPSDVPSSLQAVTMLDGIFVAHYYLESLTWKFSNAHNRAVVLPLLKHPAPALSEATPYSEAIRMR
jgi:hypothetical protein